MCYPDILDVLEASFILKGGKRKGKRPTQAVLPEPRFDSIHEEHAYNAAMAKENAVALTNVKHITTQPLWVQQAFAMRNKSMDELFPKK